MRLCSELSRGRAYEKMNARQYKHYNASQVVSVIGEMLALLCRVVFAMDQIPSVPTIDCSCDPHLKCFQKSQKHVSKLSSEVILSEHTWKFMQCMVVELGSRVPKETICMFSCAACELCGVSSPLYLD